MKTFTALLKREFKTVISSPILYILLLAFMLYNGYSFWLIITILNQPITPPGSPMELFFGQSVIYWLILLVLASFLTMGTIADERKLGTIELLLTAPVREWEVILAKFLATWIIYIVLWFPTFIYVLILIKYGEPDLGPIFSGYLGTFLMGGMLLSVGIFTSTITKHSIIAAIMSFVLLCIMFFMGLFEYLPISPGTQKVVHYINWWGHMEDWSKGIVDSGHIVYYLTVMGLFLFTSVRTLELRILRPLEAFWFLMLLLFFPIALILLVILKKKLWEEKVRFSRILNSSAQILLMLLLVGMVNYISIRHYHRFDWTKGKVFTLSDRTKKVIQSLPTTVDIYVFLSQTSDLYPEVKRLLENYLSIAKGKIRVEYVDPDLNPVKFKEAKERFKVESGVDESGREVSAQVIVAYANGRRKFVLPEDLTELDTESTRFGGAYIFKPSKAESAITSAIYSVTETKKHKVCFTTGHGEWDINNYSPESRGLGYLKEPFENYNFQMEEINLREKNEIPAECELVVVAGPTIPFLTSEVNTIDKYLKDGGDLILLLDPLLSGDEFVPTGFEAMLKNYNIRLHQDIAIEKDERRIGSFCGGGHPTSFLAGTSSSSHPIIEMLKPLPNIIIPVCFERVRSIEIIKGGKIEPVALMESSKESFGETDGSQLLSPEKQENDIQGPLTLAVALELDNKEAHLRKIKGDTKIDENKESSNYEGEAKTRGSRLIVVGDSDFLSQRLLQYQALGNLSFLNGVFGWTIAREALISVPPKDIERVKLSLTEEQMTTVVLILFVFIPIGIIIIGAGMWWQRKRSS